MNEASLNNEPLGKSPVAPPSPKRWQFGLKHCLLAFTVFGLILFPIVRAAHAYWRQRQAIASIPGTVTARWDGRQCTSIHIANGSDEKNEITRGIGQLANLKSLEISDTKLGRHDLSYGALRPQIDSLTLRNVEFVEPECKFLAYLPEVNSVVVENCNVSPSMMARLAECPQLLFLQIRNCRVPPEAWEELSGHPKLHTLTLEGDVLTGEHHWLRGLTQLFKLNMKNAQKRPTNSPFEHLPTRSLERITLESYPATDVDLVQIAKHPKIECVALTQTGISDADLDALVNMPRLSHLELTNNGLSEAAFDGIAKCSHLAGITIDESGISGASIGKLKQLTRLSFVSARGWTIDEPRGKELEQLKLRSLRLYDCDISQDRVDRFEAAMKGKYQECQIHRNRRKGQ